MDLDKYHGRGHKLSWPIWPWPLCSFRLGSTLALFPPRYLLQARCPTWSILFLLLIAISAITLTWATILTAGRLYVSLLKWKWVDCT